MELTCSRKPYRVNEIQSHIHKLSSEFVQNEINVNYVGARPNGVNLPRILQELGIPGDRNLAAWTRTDMSSRTRRTTMKGGPVWSDVVARVTADAVSGRDPRFRAGSRHNEISGTHSIGRRASR